jgi:hypothetical protein
MGLSQYYADRQAFDDLVQGRERNQLARQAGGMLARGDLMGARNALYTGGQLEAGRGVQQGIDANAKREAEALDRWTTGLSRVLEMPQYANNPEAAWQASAPFAQRLGLDPMELEQQKTAYLSNPKAWTTFVNGQAKKDLQFFQTDQGIYVGDKGTGDVRQAAKLPGKPQMYGDFLYVPEDNGNPIPGGTPGFNSSQPAPQAGSDGVFNSLIQQESGGRAGVLGPQTRYGRAEGMTQMLPGTAQEMASKLGIPWRPDLMRGTSPEAAEYQRQLGRAYYEEGLQKYGGDQSKALMYYHGGPNERLWGPKTRAYAQQVLARAGGSDAPMQGGAGADDLTGAPQVPGMRAVGRVKGGAEGERWTSDGKGFLVNKNGDVKSDPRYAGTTPDAGKVTEGERTAGFLSSRLADSLKNLTEIGGRNPTARKPGLVEVIAENIPKTGGKAANMVRDADRQQVIANQLDVLDAALTLGTGAAYTREQLENYRDVYFPKLTDKPETVRAKGQKLISLLEAAKIKAGRSAPPALDTAIAAARKQYAATEARATAPAKPAQQAGGLPQAARSQLKPGQVTTFANGQRWTLRNGQPVRVN